jgi:dimethyladenosine transferase (EC 2.1.1.-)
MDKAIGTPQRTKAILEKYGFTFKKRYGQNFLVDVNILQNIANAAELTKNSGALEIGPGIGALTEQLAKRCCQVITYEIDRRLITVLSETLAPYPNVTVLAEDFLKADVRSAMDRYLRGVKDMAIVANLPYYITTPILMKCLQEKLPVRTMVFMMQKEVGDRLTALPGTKDYSSLSIAVQYFATVEKVMDVPRSVFWPQPNVDSIVLRLHMREKPPVFVEDESLFSALSNPPSPNGGKRF